MARYRKKPVVIDATQWFKNGDHPEDNAEFGNEVVREGQVVRYYRHPNDDGRRNCEHCGRTMHDHGWIDTLEGGHVVCPGDYVITGVRGERYPCKPDIFEQTYEPAHQVSGVAEGTGGSAPGQEEPDNKE